MPITFRSALPEVHWAPGERASAKLQPHILQRLREGVIGVAGGVGRLIGIGDKPDRSRKPTELYVTGLEARQVMYGAVGQVAEAMEPPIGDSPTSGFVATAEPGMGASLVESIAAPGHGNGSQFVDLGQERRLLGIGEASDTIPIPIATPTVWTGETPPVTQVSGETIHNVGEVRELLKLEEAWLKEKLADLKAKLTELQQRPRFRVSQGTKLTADIRLVEGQVQRNAAAQAKLGDGLQGAKDHVQELQKYVETIRGTEWSNGSPRDRLRMEESAMRNELQTLRSISEPSEEVIEKIRQFERRLGEIQKAREVLTHGQRTNFDSLPPQLARDLLEVYKPDGIAAESGVIHGPTVQFPNPNDGVISDPAHAPKKGDYVHKNPGTPPDVQKVIDGGGFLGDSIRQYPYQWLVAAVLTATAVAGGIGLARRSEGRRKTVPVRKHPNS